MKPDWHFFGIKVGECSRLSAMAQGHRFCASQANNESNHWDDSSIKMIAEALATIGYRMEKIPEPSSDSIKSEEPEKPEPIIPALSGCPVCDFHHPPDGVCLV